MIETLTLTVMSGLALLAGPPALPAPQDKPVVRVVVPAPSNGTTVAEQISRLHRAVQADEKVLEKLQAEDGPGGEYQQAETDFKALDAALQEKTREAEALKAAGKSAETVLKEMAEMQPKWLASKERFNLAIENRKVRRSQAEALRKKLARGRADLARLKGEDVPAATPAPSPGAVAPPPAVAQPVPKDAAPKDAAPKATAPEPAVPLSRQAREAKEKADYKEEKARKATENVQSLRERVEAIRADLEMEHKLADGARKKLALAGDVKAGIVRELKELVGKPHTADQVHALEVKLAEADLRVDRARADLRTRTERSQELQMELASVQSEQIAALREAQDKRHEAEQARQEAVWLENPLHPRNLLRWVTINGPRILAILIGIAFLYLLTRAVGRQLVHVMARNSHRGSEEERHNRAETLIGIFHSAAHIIIFGGGLLMLLESVGIPIVPLLGGAAVVGLAVAFGAQNLIRDYFAGFMVLMEDQYSINDVVKIGEVSGLVEKITLRVTVLRDLGGVVHFIPHGTISNVSNLTHGWSRALFDIGVAYKEDVDRVMQILTDLSYELRSDPAYKDLVIDGPEMLGVDSFNDSAIIIKFFLKTKPLKQWPVKREMLRRIKKRFDELGIEIPFPHRTVYHRHETEADVEVASQKRVA